MLKEVVDFIVQTGQPLAYVEDNHMPYRFKNIQHTDNSTVYTYRQDILHGKEIKITVPKKIKSKIEDYNNLKRDIYDQIQIDR